MYARLRAVAGPREGLPLRAVFVHPDDGESYPVFEEDAGASRPDPGTGARPGANRRVGDMGAPRPAPEEDTGRGGDGPAARTPGDGAEHRPVPGEHREDLRGER